MDKSNQLKGRGSLELKKIINSGNPKKLDSLRKPPLASSSFQQLNIVQLKPKTRQRSTLPPLPRSTSHHNSSSRILPPLEPPTKCPAKIIAKPVRSFEQQCIKTEGSKQRIPLRNKASTIPLLVSYDRETNIKSRSRPKLIDSIQKNGHLKTSPYKSSRPIVNRPRSRQISQTVTTNDDKPKLHQKVNCKTPSSTSFKIPEPSVSKCKINGNKSNIKERSPIKKVGVTNSSTEIKVKRSQEIPKKLEKSVSASIPPSLEVKVKEIKDISCVKSDVIVETEPDVNPSSQSSSSTIIVPDMLKDSNFTNLLRKTLKCAATIKNQSETNESCSSATNQCKIKTPRFIGSRTEAKSPKQNNISQSSKFRMDNKDNLPYPLSKELLNEINEIFMIENVINPPLNSPVSSPTSPKANCSYHFTSHLKKGPLLCPRDGESDEDSTENSQDLDKDETSEPDTGHNHDFVADYLQLESMREVNHITQVMCCQKICRKVKGADPKLNLEQLKLAKSHYLDLPCFADDTFFTKIKVPPEIYMNGKQPDKDFVNIKYLQNKMDDLHKKKLKNFGGGSSTLKGDSKGKKKTVNFSPECYVKSMEVLQSLQLPQWAKDCFDSEEEDNDSSTDEDTNSPTKSSLEMTERTALAKRILNMYQNGKLKNTKIKDKSLKEDEMNNLDDSDDNESSWCESRPESP